MKLSKLEQESIILYNEEESTASIYTCLLYTSDAADD